MFAEFNYNYLPFIKVKFDKNIESDEEFFDFINTWENINNKKEKKDLLICSKHKLRAFYFQISQDEILLSINHFQ